MPDRSSTALPIAWITLRVLIILNWVYGACIFALLAYTFIDEAFLMRALGLGSPSENPSLVMGIRAIAALDSSPSPLTWLFSSDW